MNRWAIVDNGEVVNSIVADASFIEVLRNDHDSLIETTDLAPWPSVGWTWNGETFAPPPEPELVEDESVI